MAQSRESQKAMFAKKSANFQVGDKVVFSRVEESVFRLPPRMLFDVNSKAVGIGKVLGTGRVTRIKNVKFPMEINGNKGLISIDTDAGISGGIGTFEKFDPKLKYKLLPKGNIVGVEK